MKYVLSTAAAILAISGAGPAGAQTPEQQPQQPAEATEQQLPPVVVEQPQAKPAPKPKKKIVKKAPAKAKPAAPGGTAPAAPQPAAVPAGTAEETGLAANAGSPSANTEPVLGVAGNPVGQTVTSVGGERTRNDPVFSATDLLKASPGISVKQGNGPRDIGVSIRGSNARQGFGIRNIQVLEDGFPVTQPDGLSRTDLTDPHAYSAVDVWRGPSSALFGNYAVGGALNFRTWRGREINGVEYGFDGGSFGYRNNYLLAGGVSGTAEASLFMSDVRGDGFFGYSSYSTQTLNALLTAEVTPDDRVTVKVIDNELYTELPFRASLNNFRTNPYQKGCDTAATKAAGCETQGFSATGSGTRKQQTAAEAGVRRDDRRSVLGVRWEHKISPDTSWRIQYVADDKNINQPTGTTGGVGDEFAHNVIAGITHRNTFAGLAATHYLGLFWNGAPQESTNFNIAPGGNAVHGLVRSKSKTDTANWGLRAREEIEISEAWTAVAGLSAERTTITGQSTSFTYNSSGKLTNESTVFAERGFWNTAPEAGLLFRPSREWQFRTRVGTGYGTPDSGALFVSSTGDPGNNTSLKAQTNTGYDVGADWTPAPGVLVSVTGFYEFFKNEFVTQATEAGKSNFTFNAPASEHRGVEAAVDWRFGGGWRLFGVYTLNDQFYTEYVERIAGTNIVREFDRKGKKIPGVAPQELNLRFGYDQPEGLFKGLGVYVEYEWRDDFFMDNANLLSAPDAEAVNLNVHYNVDVNSPYLTSLAMFFEVRNIFDKANIASANNLQNSINASGVEHGADVLATKAGSIYAGTPRAFYGGVKMKF